MNENLKRVFKSCHQNWQLLYDLFENLPEDKLDWTVAKGNRTLKEQMAHIVGVEKCYLEVIKFGAEGWKHCHMEDDRVKWPKEKLMNLFKEADRELGEILQDKKPDEKIDWTEGNYLSLVEHLHDLNNHQKFHHGQLVIYIRNLGRQYFPDSWSIYGY